MTTIDENEMPIEGEDFSYVETDDPAVLARSKNPVVELLSRGYEGAMIQYGKIQFCIEDDPPKLSFDYIVLNPGKHSKEDLEKDTRFKNMLGDIIIATLKDMAKRKQENESRNGDPQIPN